ncbi:MAG TPA: ATP-dependent zinc protease [Methyloceanibacter sp.]|jgi:hypothetical protein
MKQTGAKDTIRIGWREWVGLPELGVDAVKAKIDTGARTSALHAWNIEPFRRSGSLWVRFEIHPIQRSESRKVLCEARAIDERTVRNSGGGVERRYIIKTEIKLGASTWPIELALTNRDQMGFRMLLGRTALGRRTLIVPSRSFLASPRSPLKPRRGRHRATAFELSKLLP